MKNAANNWSDKISHTPWTWAQWLGKWLCGIGDFFKCPDMKNGWLRKGFLRQQETEGFFFLKFKA